MVSHVQKADLDRIVPRSVSVTTTASVWRPQGSVFAAPDTLENGKSNFLHVIHKLCQKTQE